LLATSICWLLLAGTAQASATAPDNTTPPSVTGTDQQGQVLTLTPGTSDNSPTSITDAWEDCDTTGVTCTPVSSGASGTTYTLTAADVGHTIEVLESENNTTETVSSTATATVIALAPADSVLPTITGTAQQGQTLTAGTGTWSNTPTSYAYQSEDCTGATCTAITNANGSTYPVPAADVGFAIEVQVTATNTGGNSAPVISGRTAVIMATSTTGLVVPSDPVTNQNVTLVATITSSSGNASPSGSVTFKKGGGAIGGCANEPVKSSSQSVTVICQTTFAASTPTLSAVYAPGSGSLVMGSSSSTTAVTVGRAPTSTSLTVSKRVSVATNTTFIATVNPPASSSGPIQPSGSVEFLDAGKPIAACLRRALRSQAATCKFKYKTTGTHRIKASYSGNSNFGGSSSSSHRLKAVRAAPKVLGIITSFTNWIFNYHPAYTSIQQLVVTGVTPGTSVFVTCHGSGCPFAKHTTTVAKSPHCVSKGKRRCSASHAINLVPIFHGAHLSIGSKIRGM
jgi:Bacterial Ig-like domain (group 3)